MPVEDQIETFKKGLAPRLARDVVVRQGLGELLDMPSLSIAVEHLEHAFQQSRDQAAAAYSTAAARFAPRRPRSGAHNGTPYASGSGDVGHINAIPGGGGGKPNGPRPSRPLTAGTIGLDQLPAGANKDQYESHIGSQKWIAKYNEQGEPLCFCCTRYGHIKADCPDYSRLDNNPKNRTHMSNK
jgi:hypothetical protein